MDVLSANHHILVSKHGHQRFPLLNHFLSFNFLFMKCANVAAATVRGNAVMLVSMFNSLLASNPNECEP